MEKHHHSEIIKCMQHAGFYPHAVESTELRQTHISSVILTGPFAYKIKKPVDMGFLNFSTLASRRHYCETEISLNRRLSHGVYIEVIPITYDGNTYSLNGSGEIVEYTVKMRQLHDHDAMKHRLRQNSLSDTHIKELTGILTRFYANASCAAQSLVNINPVEENFTVLQTFADRFIDLERFEMVRKSVLNFFRHQNNLFVRRSLEGKIRDGHGDLRTDHIYFTPEGIQIIDCLEFSAPLRYQDIISDLAFLAVDLEDNDGPELARSLIHQYIDNSHDLESLSLYDFYRCYRAMVLCKVNCLRSQQIDPYTLEYKRRIAKADRYLAMAHAYAKAFCRPLMWIVCGLPASGKSTIAAELSAVFDCQVLRSDVIRKTIFAQSTIPPNAFAVGIYSADATAATYDMLLATASSHLKKKRCVVLDATFSTATWRTAATQIAEHLRAVPIFVECQAPESILVERLKRRESEHSISDARLQHLEEFKRQYEPFKQLEDVNHLTVNSGQPLQECLCNILLDYTMPSTIVGARAKITSAFRRSDLGHIGSI